MFVCTFPFHSFVTLIEILDELFDARGNFKWFHQVLLKNKFPKTFRKRVDIFKNISSVCVQLRLQQSLQNRVDY